MKEILEYCQGEEEKGGIVIGGEFVALKNIAKDKVNNFEFKLDNYNFERIEAIVHNHIGDYPYLSSFDRLAQVETGLPWWIVANGKIHKYKCVDLLRGREFEYGKYDCGTLIEDAYAICGINLRHYKRKTMEADEANSVITERLPKLGFSKVSSAQPGDVIATSMGGNPNHLALVLDDERILHHVAGQYSRVVAYGALRKYCGKEIEIYGRTVNETMRSLCIQIPNLKRHMKYKKYNLKVGHRNVGQDEYIDGIGVEKDIVVRVIPVIHGAGPFALVAGAALAALSTTTLVSAAVGAILLQIGIGLMLSGAAALLTKQPKFNQDHQGVEDSKSSSFSNLSNMVG